MKTIILAIDISEEEWVQLCVEARGEAPTPGQVNVDWGISTARGGQYPDNVGFRRTWHRVPEAARMISDDLAQQIAAKVVAPSIFEQVFGKGAL